MDMAELVETDRPLSVLERLAVAATGWPEALRGGLIRALERIARETKTDAEAGAILRSLAGQWNRMFKAADAGEEFALRMMARDGIDAMTLAAASDRVMSAATALGRGQW